MADYKVVDTEQLNADITQIANAIREKAGTTDAMLFPSGLVEAIANMETGGGLPSGIAKIDYGVYIPARDTDITSSITVSIEHTLGEAPDFFYFVCLDEPAKYNGSDSLTSIYFYLATRVNGEAKNGSIHTEAVTYYGVGPTWSNGHGYQTNVDSGFSLNATKVIIKSPMNGTGQNMFVAHGRPYRWVVGKFA